MTQPEKTVHRIHFEDRSGVEFERLCFAYLFRQYRSGHDHEWYGQLGADRGRDICFSRQSGAFVVAQCANYRSLRFKKVKEDLDKIVAGPGGLPAEFILITGGSVGAVLRDKIKTYAHSLKIKTVQIWPGAEFEERLRADQPELIKRFVEGVTFPDAPGDFRDWSPLSPKQKREWESIMAAWVNKVDLDQWDFRTAPLLTPEASLTRQCRVFLENLRKWLFSIDLPSEPPSLSGAFHNFNKVLVSLLKLFSAHMEPTGDEYMYRRYRKELRGFDQKLYDERLALDEWVACCHLDLVFELTRAANLIVSRFRERIDPGFRAGQGVLTVSQNDAMSEICHKPLYTTAEKKQLEPFSSFEDFLESRSERSQVFGNGQAPPLRWQQRT